MPAQKPPESYLPVVISVTAMAKLCSMSRARFYELAQQGVFLLPVYCTTTKKPMFLREQVNDNLKARATGIGINGQYILFYDRRPRAEALPRAELPRPKTEHHAGLIEGLKSLGLTATGPQITAAIAHLYPAGTANVDETTVLRAVYRHLRRTEGA